MKRQVFFFLLIFSCSEYAMQFDHAINQVTGEQLANALGFYCVTYPHTVNLKNAIQEIDRIRSAKLTFADKKEIVEKMRQFPRPSDTLMIGNRFLLVERDSHEEFRSIDRVH